MDEVGDDYGPEGGPDGAEEGSEAGTASNGGEIDVGSENADLFYGLDLSGIDEAGKPADADMAEPPTEVRPATAGPLDAGYSEATETETLREMLEGVNPNYDPFDIESPWSNNCGSCALAVEGRLNGDMQAAASAENVGTVEEMEALTGKEQVAMSPSEIEQTLLAQGPGAHAIVGVDRFDGPGHWFNAVVSADGSKVYAIDGQSGEMQGWPPDYGNVSNWDMSMEKEN